MTRISRYRTFGRALAIAAAVVALTAPGSAAASARAAAGCSITGFAPHSVVVGASPVTTTFSISTTGCSGGRYGWSLDDSSASGFYVSDSGPQSTFDPNIQSDSDAGLSSVVAEAYDHDFHDTQRSFVDGFDLKRRVATVGGTMNASPEPVRRGGTVTISARVVVVDWDYTPHYVAFAGHTMAVQFRTDSGTYHTVKNVKTDASGTVHTTATQSSSGYWRVAYGGTTTFGPMVALGDHVVAH